MVSDTNQHSSSIKFIVLTISPTDTIYKIFASIIWRPPSQSELTPIILNKELTPIILNVELTHLSTETSIYICYSSCLLFLNINNL